MIWREKFWFQPQLQTGEARVGTVIRQTVHGSQGRPGIGFNASKQPVAVIIATPSGCRVISLQEGAHQFLDDERIRREINTFASEVTAP